MVLKSLKFQVIKGIYAKSNCDCQSITVHVIVALNTSHPSLVFSDRTKFPASLVIEWIRWVLSRMGINFQLRHTLKGFSYIVLNSHKYFVIVANSCLVYWIP